MTFVLTNKTIFFFFFVIKNVIKLKKKKNWNIDYK